MATKSQATILDTFQAAAGSPADGGSVADLIDPLTQATAAINAQTQATGANTDALGQNTSARGSSGGGGAAGVFNTVSQFLGGGLSLMPLVSIFTSLFGGGQSQPAPLVPYSLPPALDLEASSNNYQSLIYGENGLPRAAPDAGGAAASAGQQITVQVQAIDSQSFLDHSDEIASAVQQAMLNMHPINDVISEL